VAENKKGIGATNLAESPISDHLKILKFPEIFSLCWPFSDHNCAIFRIFFSHKVNPSVRTGAKTPKQPRGP
jgi:hypothetical protein